MKHWEELTETVSAKEWNTFFDRLRLVEKKEPEYPQFKIIIPAKYYWTIATVATCGGFLIGWIARSIA